MCHYNLVSRALGINGAQKIQAVLDKRIEYKKNNETELSDGLKMALVAIYGSMNFEQNDLYDPQQRTAVCIVGQLLLYILCLELEKYATIIQLNTDGIMLIPHDTNKCEEIYKE